jgi:hypothetical protein
MTSAPWVSRMYALLLLAAIVSVRPACAAESLARVILDVVRIPATADQPTWIGLSTSGATRIIHVPAGGTVVSVPPARYTVRHIDFGESSNSGVGTWHYGTLEQPITFEASTEWVSFVGLIQLTRATQNFQSNRRIGLVTPDEMLSWACAADAQTLSTLPVRVRLSQLEYKLIKVNCQT